MSSSKASLKIVEKLHGNWSCVTDSWSGLRELLMALQSVRPWAVVVLDNDEFVANVFGDGDALAVQVHGPKSFESFVGASLTEIPSRSDLYGIEVLRNEEHRDDGTWVMVPHQLMFDVDQAIAMLRGLVDKVHVPTTHVPLP